MQITYSRLSKDSLSRSIRTASLGVLAWLLAWLPAQVANGQGTVIFGNSIPGGPGVGQTTHVWGPSTTTPGLSLVGLGSNNNADHLTRFAPRNSKAKSDWGMGNGTPRNRGTIESVWLCGGSFLAMRSSSFINRRPRLTKLRL